MTNYHPFFDIIISVFAKITPIYSSILLFQITPILLSSLIIILSYQVGKLYTKNQKGGYLFAFFNIFATSAGWVVTLVSKGYLGGESFFWSMQSISTQINPPLALSIVFLLLFILLLNRQKYPFIIFLLAIITPITKSYAGFALFAFFGTYILIHKKFRLLFFLSLISAIIVFIFYNPSPSKLLIFQPFWFINSMFSSTDRLYIPKVASFINTIILSQHFDLRFYLIEMVGLVIFIIGNFAFRIIGLTKINLKDKSVWPLFLAVIACLIIPTIFIQAGTPWNTIQFLYYSLFFCNLLLTIYLTQSSHRNLIIIIIIFCLIGSVDTLSWALGNPAPATLSSSERAALSFLSKQPGSIVLTYPFNPYLRFKYTKTPLPLYVYETSAYVSAYSRKYTFLEDEMNLTISGYNSNQRRSDSLEFFKLENKFKDRGFLLNNQIDYVYIANSNDQAFHPTDQEMGLQLIYNNNQTMIYKVIK